MSEKTIKVLLEIELPIENEYYLEIDPVKHIKEMFSHEHCVKVSKCHVIDKINLKNKSYE